MSRLKRLSHALLRGLRLPPEPTPPAGAPGSIRVFRAARNYYNLRLAFWTFRQAATLAGLIFAIVAIDRLYEDVVEIRNARAGGGAAETGRQFGAETEKRGIQLPRELVENVAHFPLFVFNIVTVFEILGSLAFVAQISFTYFLLRLDYELRWYIVTDRSLRIRAGIVRVQESTMSFANVQQVTVTQGPLQRLLSIADVRVRSAGGGAGAGDENQKQDSLHVGVFHGVDNAAAIRDLIIERLRRFREAGLGDPDDDEAASARSDEAAHGSTLEAARAVLAEAQELRRVVAGPSAT